MALVTAAFVLCTNDPQRLTETDHLLISFASGSKCLPHQSLPPNGDALRELFNL